MKARLAAAVLATFATPALAEFYVSISDAIRQNTLGMSEGFPAGVPKSYNWYKGWNPDGQAAPGAHFTAVTGWGQVYHKVGQPTYANPNARVEIANARTYVHLRSTGEWVLVQEQATNPLVGGHFVPDFKGNAAIQMLRLPAADGSVAFSAPPTGYNNHFWATARGEFADGSVDAVYVQMDMRVTDPNLKLVASVGADWWRDAAAPYLQDHSNNPGAGSSNWVELSTEWRMLAFYSSNAIFQANLPPTLLSPTVDTRPTIASFSPDTSAVGDGITSSNVLMLSGLARAGTSVVIFDGSTRVGTVTANGRGVWSFTTGQLSNTSHAFTARNLAANGSTGLASSALTVTVDSIAPAASKNSPRSGTGSANSGRRRAPASSSESR